MREIKKDVEVDDTVTAVGKHAAASCFAIGPSCYSMTYRS